MLPLFSRLSLVFNLFQNKCFFHTHAHTYIHKESPRHAYANALALSMSLNYTLMLIIFTKFHFFTLVSLIVHKIPLIGFF